MRESHWAERMAAYLVVYLVSSLAGDWEIKRAEKSVDWLVNVTAGRKGCLQVDDWAALLGIDWAVLSAGEMADLSEWHTAVQWVSAMAAY